MEASGPLALDPNRNFDCLYCPMRLHDLNLAMSNVERPIFLWRCCGGNYSSVLSSCVFERPRQFS